MGPQAVQRRCLAGTAVPTVDSRPAQRVLVPHSRGTWGAGFGSSAGYELAVGAVNRLFIGRYRVKSGCESVKFLCQ